MTTKNKEERVVRGRAGRSGRAARGPGRNLAVSGGHMAAPPVRQFVPMAGPREGFVSETPATLQRIAQEGGKNPAMTLRQLHRDTGCSVSLLSRVFNGRRRVSLKVAISISKATGCPVERISTILDENRNVQLASSVLVPSPGPQSGPGPQSTSSIVSTSTAA